MIYQYFDNTCFTFVKLTLELGAGALGAGVEVGVDLGRELLHPTPLPETESDIGVHGVGTLTGEDLILLLAKRKMYGSHQPVLMDEEGGGGSNFSVIIE